MKYFPPASASKPASMVVLGVGIGVSVGAALLYAKCMATDHKKSRAKRMPTAQEQLQIQPAQASVKDDLEAAPSSITAVQAVEEAAPVVVASPVNTERDGTALGEKRSVREIARYYAESAFASRMGEGPAGPHSVQVESHANVSVRTMAMYFDSRGPFGVMEDHEDDE